MINVGFNWIVSGFFVGAFYSDAIASILSAWDVWLGKRWYPPFRTHEFEPAGLSVLGPHPSCGLRVSSPLSSKREPVIFFTAIAAEVFSSATLATQNLGVEKQAWGQANTWPTVQKSIHLGQHQVCNHANLFNSNCISSFVQSQRRHALLVLDEDVTARLSQRFGQRKRRGTSKRSLYPHS